MLGHRKIPLVKPKIDLNASQRRTNLTLLGILISGLAVLLYLGIKVQFDVLLTRNQRLETELKQLEAETARYQFELTTLTSLANVRTAAKERGMVQIPIRELLPHEEKIEETSR